MLNAEENVVLPLSLAGEKPDKEWVAELMRKIGLEQRRGHRPSELSGGQQQRVAIGRALVSRPTIVFADEPTGNLDSKTSSEILALMRDSVDGYGQTTVMVTHDPRAATIADRILFLADGLIVRDLGASERERGHRRERGARTMIAVALKGLWGRKLRTLLTALAIVLGVAMISGTYVLTDSITAAFTNIVDDSFTNADAVISGKVAFKNDDSNTGEGVVPAFPASVLTKVKQLPDVAAASGEVGDQAKLLGRDGKVISTGGGGSIGSSIDPANDARFTPLKLVSGQWPVGGGQIAIDKHTADTQHFGVGDTIGVAANQGTRRFEITGIATYADSASIGAATIAIFDVPTAQRLFSKVGRYDGIQVAAKDGRHTREARQRDPAAAAGHGKGEDRRRADRS